MLFRAAIPAERAKTGPAAVLAKVVIIGAGTARTCWSLLFAGHDT